METEFCPCFEFYKEKLQSSFSVVFGGVQNNVLFTLKLLLEINYHEESLGSVSYSQYLIISLKALSPGAVICSMLYTKKQAHSEILGQGDHGIKP